MTVPTADEWAELQAYCVEAGKQRAHSPFDSMTALRMTLKYLDALIIIRGWSASN